MLNIGTDPKKLIYSPRFKGGQYGYARTHLLAKVLGGSAKAPRTLVTLWKNLVNSPKMRDYE